MKSLFRLSALLMLLCFMGCSDDEGISYPTSDAPEIKVLRDELYSNPNRKFVIKADLKDDLGLKSLKIVIPEFYLDKEIVFPTDTLVTEYELAYEFLAPKDTKNEDVYKVTISLETIYLIFCVFLLASTKLSIAVIFSSYSSGLDGKE